MGRRKAALINPSRLYAILSQRCKNRTRIESVSQRGRLRCLHRHFQDLHGLDQLPGIASQRLMADRYGFAGEGGWKTAALVRIMKVMAVELVHALGIGGEADPARLVFTAPSGPAVVASLVEMSDGFRLIVNEVDVVQPDESLPTLPFARAVWLPKPNLKVAAAAWIYAGVAHHASFSQALTTEHLEDFAEIAGIELIVIDADTRLRELRNHLR
jgi:L-arabinose isomerase